MRLTEMVAVVRTKIIFIVVDQHRAVVTNKCHRDVNKADKCVRFVGTLFLSMPIVAAFAMKAQRHSSMHFNDAPICGTHG
jgi:hypothetical protein